jgi:hypothetical protein
MTTTSVNGAGEAAFRREFMVRYRLPRPVSRSYEAVLFSRYEDEIGNKVSWCAAVAVRFIAALRQALLLASDPNASISPPGEKDLRLAAADGAFAGITRMPSPVGLLQLAGIYPGAAVGPDKTGLLECLQELGCLCRYRIAVVEPEGIRILLGPRMEYFIWSRVSIPGFEPGSAVLVDIDAGDFISLTPLMLWHRDPHHPLGSLMLLRWLAGENGRYVEDGVPGSPGLMLPMTARPVAGRLEPDLLGRIREPGFRFPDGSTVENFAVQGVVWKGSMSDIYVAWNRDRGEAAVLKTFENRGGGFDENYWYFINEEKFTARLIHPGIVKPRRFRGEGFGVVYEEEFVDGGSLSDVMEDTGVLTPADSKKILLDILDTLDHVHAAGIAHNDIKPDNILFGRDGKARLIDFGIAVDYARSDTGARRGAVAGTDGYMAPELRQGGLPSASSDIYSLGVVFGQMLSGRILESYDEANSDRAVPRSFLDFFKRCLSSDPTERFGSANEASESLRMLDTVQRPCITLDVEGTLVTNFGERHPRPGLYRFLEFCLENFERIFIYTILSPEQVVELFGHIRAAGAVPAGFIERYEQVDWPRGSAGSIKDLRRCRVPVEYNAIIDDMAAMIPEDQQHRWIPIPDYNSPDMVDNGFVLARNGILKKFKI